MSRRTLRGLLFPVLALASAIGCASAPVVNKPGGPSAMANEYTGAPVWVLSNCSKYLKKSVICAMGAAGGTQNPALARTAAEERGRTEIAREIQTEVRAAVHDYQATTTGGTEFGKAAADEQHIVDVAKNITDLSLSGVVFDESWISQSGTFYALMSLDVDKFKDMVNNMKTLSEGVRKSVTLRADKAFNELDAETGHAPAAAPAAAN